MKSSPRRALITGITGQDGSYLAELLLEKGYEVHGIVRRASTFNTGRLVASVRRSAREIHALDPALRRSDRRQPFDQSGARCRTDRDLQPRRRATCACRSTNRCTRWTWRQWARCDCWKRPGSSRNESRCVSIRPRPAKCTAAATRFRRSETTPFHPRSPYACGKVFAFHQVVNYREAYDLFACNGILFNHESPRRGETFVTRKITRAARGSPWAWNENCIWATWTPSAIGALPEIMSRRCG